MGVIHEIIKICLIKSAGSFCCTDLSFFFIPSDLRVARIVNISAPGEKVIATVGDFNSWKDWNKIAGGNTLTNVRISSPSAGKGAQLSSDELTVRETAVDSGGVSLHWSLKGGKEVEGGFQVGASNTGSVVVWYFDLHFRWYPLGEIRDFCIRSETRTRHGGIFGQPEAIC
ncbi:SRPBCC family protein [Puia sp. P3]|uniref:SRPBCC family protein n=1 Tax=Puia sp. P3 TaxID=3423952 RepID=UPI003D671999